LENLHNKDLFENDTPIYVGWALTKAERERQFATKQVPNETKLYIRSLKLDVDAEKLKEAFKNFGTPVSSSVREIKRDDQTLKFGFVEMSSKEEADAVLTDGTSHPAILELVTVNPAYIKIAQSKVAR